MVGFAAGATLLLLPSLAAALVAQTPPPPVGAPHWIWDAAAADDEELWFRKTFELADLPAAAALSVSCDNHARVYVNGREVLRSDIWQAPGAIDVTAQLRVRTNVIAVHAANDGGPAALAVKLACRDRVGKENVIVTDASWKVFGHEVEGWQKPDHDDSKWPAASVHGVLGAPGLPWTRVLGAAALDVETEDMGPQRPAAAPEVDAPDGHRVERLYRVPAAMGSWVSMCRDPNGRLYTSAEQGGLYRVTPAGVAGAEATSVEVVPVAIGGCQGLCWAFGSLYAVANGTHSGLYRLRDTDGDDVLDEAVLLRLLDGKGEHGPHAVVPAPDGGNLLVLCGNHTRLPELARSRLPRNWQDDVLLPRIDDPEGHAVGIEAPGGFVCLVDPDGMEWELYCAGLRNAYDLAVAPDGAVFTFDADMEWDMGLPWYRPTRILEVVSGGDYGWRAGSAKWPADFPDTLPAVVDIGPGSPTGMLWTRHGVLALDWTFGIVYRVRPAPSGAGFRGASARFLAGQPLPLVDAVADGDGCLLLTGGRGVVSNLYRVLPAQPGHPSAAGAWPGNEAGRQERRRLEAFHGRADPTAADAAWPHLGSTDPFLRHAARIAVESQPVDAWRRRALAAPTDPPWSALTALLALARQGVPEDLAGIVAALGRMRFSSLDRSQRIAWLRIHQLALRRMGGSGAALQAAAVGQLQPHFPSGDPRLDAELCALLCWLDAPGVLDRAVPLLQVLRPAAPPPWKDLTLRSAEYGPDIGRMLQAMPPTDQIAIANALRTVRHGWTLEQRAVLFRFLGEARRKKGGASHDGYLGAMLDHAWDGCSEAERAELAGVAGMAMAPLPAFRGTPPHGPGRNWRLDEAAALARHGLKERNFASGRNLFHAAGCASCHRFAGEGGSVGQDLTSLGNRFTSRDVLEAILEPNKVISDQYGGSVLRRKDGSTLSGRAVRSGAGADEAWVVWPTVADPKPVRVPAADVVSVEPSPLSPMPAGLVDRLGPDELLDLLAFLLSRGDGAGPMFAR